MRVRFYAPPFSDHSALDDAGMIDLPDGANLGDLLALAKIPMRGLMVAFFTVNWARASLSTPLEDGDTVSFIPLLAGG